MSLIIKSGATSDLATVDSNKGLRVNVASTAGGSGFVSLAAETDPGTVTGSRTVRELDISNDFRLRTGRDSLLFNDVFNYGTANAGVYQITTATATVALANGFMTLNAGSSITSGHVARVQTYTVFPTFTTFDTYFQAAARTVNGVLANKVLELGLGYATGTTGPTDGVFFRWNQDGELRGVVAKNSVERQTAAMTAPADNEIHEYLIVFNNNRVEFWIDNVKYGSLDLQAATGDAQGLVRSQAMPILTRFYNAATPTGAAQLQIANLSVTRGDIDNPRLWSTLQCAMGNHSLQSPPGGASTQLAQWANSAEPAAATLSNTAAGYTTLGGRWLFNAPAGAVTDYALFAYQVPAGSVTQPARNLIVRGIRIDTTNTGAAVATTPTILEWGLGIGSTAVSLATADSLTAGTRAPRRLALGMQSFVVGAAIGAQGTPIDINLDSPVVIEPGCFIHVIVRIPVGTATASQVIRGTCMINGYFE